MPDNKLHTKSKLKSLERMKDKAMKKIANQSVNFFKVDNFEASGFIDQTVKRWDSRKKSRPGRLLVKTGKGRQSIRTYGVNAKKITIKAGAKYMKFHNDGIPGRLPQRKFMGNSKKLDKKNIDLLIDALDKTV